MMMDESSFNLWRLLELIALRIKFIVIFVLFAVVLSAIISLLLPKYYMARVILLPPKDEQLKVGQGAGIQDFVSITSGLVLPVRATPTDIYARMLQSRNIAEGVIESNNLNTHYKLNSLEDVLERLDERSDFRVSDEGLLEITVNDRTPQKAADIANSFATQLDRATREITSARARSTREFIAGRLGEVSRELDSSRTELREFQQEHKAIDLDQQTQLAMQSAVNLKVELATNEIELSLKEKSLSPSHPDVITLKRRVEEIKDQISSLEFGGRDSSYLNLPVSQVPQLRMKLAELVSRVEISETLFGLLTEQFEQAKIQEKMDAPTISVLDKANPPALPYKPQKKLIVGITAFLSLILAVFFVLVIDYMERLRVNAPDDYRRAALFFNATLGWIPGINKYFFQKSR